MTSRTTQSIAPLSLRAIQETHVGPILLVDTASSQIQVALLRSESEPLWETAADEAGTALFVGVEKLLKRGSCNLADIGSFVFCDGPGSVLGIRTAAVALRTWKVLAERSVYSYCSLTLAAHHLALTENARNLSLIADARRDTWHHVSIDFSGHISSLQRIATAQLGASLAMPAHFRNWTPLPANVRIVPYDLPNLLSTMATAAIFTPAPEPDAFLHEEPVYQTWTPQIHQAG